MKIFQFLRRRQATPPPLPAVHAPNPDILWSEISAAIGAAGVHLRGDDSPAILDFPGYGGGFKSEPREAKRFLEGYFPTINEAQMTRALRYINSRVINQKRLKDAESIMNNVFNFPRPRSNRMDNPWR